MDDQDEQRLLERFAGRAGNWELKQKPRSFHRPWKMFFGVLYHLGCWATVGLGIWVGIRYWQTHERTWMVYALLAFIGHVVFRVARYSNGTSTHCPLCHGTPLHENRSRKHRFANKVLFFGPRTSSVLKILFTGTWNCMYCGTPFRLKR
ncbi:MAG: hypothetical protein KA004_02135 [Verrucomicrobiales bacterium]|nr:hypothetical protein [Verrucomicrobiales bacterium]